jgi:hypothetical protein
MDIYIFCYTFSQIWLQVREESGIVLESYYILAIFWNLLSNFGNLKKIPQNMVTLGHFFTETIFFCGLHWFIFIARM